MSEQCHVLAPPDVLKIITNEIIADSYLSFNPASQHHVGKILLKSLRRHPPNAVVQIDTSTGSERTIGSILSQSIDTAKALRSFGLNVGEVVAVLGQDHRHICVPFYASLMVGSLFTALDSSLEPDELRLLLSIVKPKVVFCEKEYSSLLEPLKGELGFELATLEDDGVDYGFVDKYKTAEPNTEFRATEFNPEDTPALMSWTSTDTCKPKAAVITHANLAHVLTVLCLSDESDFPAHSRLLLLLTPTCSVVTSLVLLQSALFCIPTCAAPRQPARPSHASTSIVESAGEIINKFKPSWVITTPEFATLLLKSPKPIIWSCVESFFLYSSSPREGLVGKLNEQIGKKAASQGYGLDEAAGVVFRFSSEFDGCLGEPLPHFEAKLVDETGEEVADDESGELWLKGPSIFKSYYYDPEGTKEAFSEDGWFKTGDQMRRDRDRQYSYADRSSTATTELAEDNIALGFGVAIEKDGVKRTTSPVRKSKRILCFCC